MRDICRRTSYCCRCYKQHLYGPHCQYELTEGYMLRLVVDIADSVDAITARCSGATAESIQAASLHHTIRMGHSHLAGAGTALQGGYMLLAKIRY